MTTIPALTHRNPTRKRGTYCTFLSIVIFSIELIATHDISAADKPNIVFMLSDDQGWNEGTVKRAREELVFHFPHYQSDDGPHSSIRVGNLKRIHFDEDDRVSLFDLSKDIGERNNLANQMPNEAKMLQEHLKKYLTDVKALLPTRNTEFDPSQPVAARKGGRGGKKGTDKK